MSNTISSLFTDSVNLGPNTISSILDDFHEGVVITDNSGTILYYNSAMGQIDQIPPDTAIGKKIVDIYDLTQEQSTTMRCLKHRAAIYNEPMFYRTRLGKITSSISNVYPIFNNNSLIGAISFTKDYHMVEKIFSTKLPQKIQANEKKNGTRYTFDDIIGRDSDLADCVRIAQMAAESPSPVLIVGETGTGKELFAQSIHNFSTYNKQLFVPINCAAIPENLLEGILFGTSKGAFTGAIDKAGLFEQANDGTLFLDELNAMPVSLQTKLLRVIQEKKVRRLGSNEEISLNLKIISSVNQDPYDEINRGNLRLDLFYRLGVVMLQIPPLRQRSNDIDKLLEHFLKKFNKQLKRNVSTISTDMTRLLYSHKWPGNIRELEHVLEGCMNLVGSEVYLEKKHLPLYFHSSSSQSLSSTQQEITGPPIHDDPLPPISAGKQIDDFISTHNSLNQLSLKSLEDAHQKLEKRTIETALFTSKGNVAKAVKMLGLSSPQALQYKMKKHKLLRSSYLQCNKQDRK